MWCLDPVYGQVVWENPLKGLGTGLAMLASVNGTSGGAGAAAAIAAQQAAQQAAAAAAAS